MISLLLSALCFTSITHAASLSVSSISSDRTQVVLEVSLPEGHKLFQDAISFSTNNPELDSLTWSADQHPQSFFDRSSQLSHNAYEGIILFTLTLPKAARKKFTLFMHFMTNKQKFPQERSVIIEPAAPASTTQDMASDAESPEQPAHTQSAKQKFTRAPSVPSLWQSLYEGLHSAQTKLAHAFITVKDHVSKLLETTTSPLLQLLLAFGLGILMSLTPCIYPMIPVTVGLLGASPGNSLARNFTLAFSYTMGIALVFAVLGLLAVFFGIQCGSFACNPWLVGFIALFLAYMGGSMFGWYEIYIPRFLQPSSSSAKRGSIVSAFFVGALSGTIASPCVSPGLALVLSMVAALKSYFKGFLLLFVFGFGTGIPLLIIGTFSATLHLLPRAGSWMNEIKKLFGFLLIMAAFSFLQSVLPLYIVYGGAGIFALLCGIVYSMNIMHRHSFLGKLFTCLVSITLMTTGLYAGYIAFIAWIMRNEQQKAVSSPAETDNAKEWLNSYAEARTVGQAQQKLLLLDFRSDTCSLCVLLEKRILSHTDAQELFTWVIPVTIDGSTRNEQFGTCCEQFKVFGMPTLLLVDPNTEEIIAKWSSEILDWEPKKFVESVKERVMYNISLQHESMDHENINFRSRVQQVPEAQTSEHKNSESLKTDIGSKSTKQTDTIPLEAQTTPPSNKGIKVVGVDF
jgi:thiol:disulfide interchange protein DsbD